MFVLAKGGHFKTKDNLLKQNWKENEVIQCLSFDYHVVRFVQRVVQAAFGLQLLEIIDGFLGGLLQQVN